MIQGVQKSRGYSALYRDGVARLQCSRTEGVDGPSLSGKHISDGTGPEPIAQAASAMFARVMAHMTSLAECRQVARPVVAGVVIEVRTGQDHAGPAERQRRRDAR